MITNHIRRENPDFDPTTKNARVPFSSCHSPASAAVGVGSDLLVALLGFFSFSFLFFSPHLNLILKSRSLQQV